MTTPTLLLPSVPSTVSACPPPPSFIEEEQYGVIPGTSAHQTELRSSLGFGAPASRGVIYHLVLPATVWALLGKASNFLLEGSGPPFRWCPRVSTVVLRMLLSAARTLWRPQRARMKGPFTSWMRWSTSSRVSLCPTNLCHHLHRGYNRRVLSGTPQPLRRCPTNIQQPALAPSPLLPLHLSAPVKRTFPVQTRPRRPGTMAPL